MFQKFCLFLFISSKQMKYLLVVVNISRLKNLKYFSYLEIKYSYLKTVPFPPNLKVKEDDLVRINRDWKVIILYYVGTKGRRNNEGYKDLAQIMIGLDDWIKKKVNHLKCIEGKGVLIDICCITQMPRSLFSIAKSLFYKDYTVYTLQCTDDTTCM